MAEVDLADEAREYPAARCRGCGVIIAVCSIAAGVRSWTCRRVKDRDWEMHLDSGWKLVSARHNKGCSKPPIGGERHDG